MAVVIDTSLTTSVVIDNSLIPDNTTSVVIGTSSHTRRQSLLTHPFIQENVSRYRHILLYKTTSVVIDNSLIPDNTTSVVIDNSHTRQLVIDNSLIPDNTTSVVIDTSLISNNTTPFVIDNSLIPDNTTSVVIDNSSLIPENTTSVVIDNSLIPDNARRS
ncbi:hypothetical protein DPMN_094846 [Dreissena polymorpha]|uniref:Uncharacterized protein n=1 Tax=Dreissena polymorpha TaxID=45954 RepID=A0A9D4L6G5_DREPO|nr:hypothetical protein DPMN_094846 [Dreissena polymorpha]